MARGVESVTKVLLLEPPKRVWDLMGDCVAPPLGLAHLAAVLEREPGVEVDILDANALGWSWLQMGEAIAEAQPDVVGTTALTPYFSTALKAMRLAKAVNPRVVTVLGGPHVTFTAEETMREYPQVDVVARGEGEALIGPLVRAIASGDSAALDDVPGIAFRRNGDVVLNPLPPAVDMRALPLPAYHLLPMNVYHFEFLGTFAVVQASRGCPHRCVFCAEWPFWGSGWRPRDPDSVVEEMEVLSRHYGRESVWFGDDCFNVDGEHMAAICEGILHRGLQVKWYYQGRADLLVRHKELLPLMRRSGNQMVQIGIEAATDDELRDLNKRLRVEQVKEAVALLRTHDIVCQGMLIIGAPGDSARSIQRRVRFAKSLDLDFPVFTLYTPFPGSEAFEQAQAKGQLEKHPDYTRFDMAHALVPTDHLSRREVGSWYWWSLTNYYLDPIKMVRGLFAGNEWKRQTWRLMTAYNLKKRVQSWI
ncbi:MAG: radical SAM protein [Chloroflexota bacterium]|nr:radical SAM protein [Chloroflexota bacterium]